MALNIGQSHDRVQCHVPIHIISYCNNILILDIGGTHCVCMCYINDVYNIYTNVQTISVKMFTISYTIIMC